MAGAVVLEVGSAVGVGLGVGLGSGVGAGDGVGLGSGTGVASWAFRPLVAPASWTVRVSASARDALSFQYSPTPVAGSWKPSL